jgi:hypothetical protein
MHNFKAKTSPLVLQPQMGLMYQSLMSMEQWWNGNYQGNIEALASSALTA